MAQRICAALSLSEKYQCPEVARVKPEISPATHCKGWLCSMVWRTRRASSDTVMAAGGGGAPALARLPGNSRALLAEDVAEGLLDI